MIDELQSLRTLFEMDPPRTEPTAADTLVYEVMARLGADGAVAATTGRYGRRSGRRKARRVAAVVVTVIAAMSGGGVAYAHFANSTEPTYRGEARCYTIASLKGGANFYGLTVAASGNPNVPAVVANALATCEADWREGFLEQGKRPLRNQLPPDQRVVPPLVACVLNDGVAAVFPGNSATCARLGLSNEEAVVAGG